MSFHLEQASLTHSDGNRALENISLTAAHGERIALIGPSGAGKTSLLRLLATSLSPSSGAVSVLNHAPAQIDVNALKNLRSRIGMVHQAPPLPPRQRVITAVLAGRLGRWPLWKSLLSLLYPLDIIGAHQQLARMGIADRLYDRCDKLSGGQLQRVGVARVLYQQPDLILADEPVSAVDPTLADQVLVELLVETRSRQVTLIASLHAVDLALKHFPRIVGLRAGHIIFDLPAQQITAALLRDLYATEGTLPTQDNRPLMLP